MTMERYLQPTAFFDYDHPRLKAWIESQLEGISDEPVEQIKALYLAVRDGISYNPYVFRTYANTFTASYALEAARPTASRRRFCWAPPRDPLVFPAGWVWPMCATISQARN